MFAAKSGAVCSAFATFVAETSSLLSMDSSSFVARCGWIMLAWLLLVNAGLMLRALVANIGCP
jgi:hypothetical protein